MHVLQYAAARTPGGLLAHVATLARGLIAAGLDVDVVLSSAAAVDAVAADLAAAGATVDRLTVRGKTDWSGLRALRRLVAGRRPDVVHVHLSSPVESAPALLAARAGGATRLLTTEHAPTFHPLRRFYSAAAKRWVSRRLSAVIAVCRSDARFLVDEFGLPERLVTVIPNGVAGFESLPPREEARRRLGLPPPPTTVIGYAGRLDARKGVLDLIDAAAKAGGDLAVALAGEGPLEGELRAGAAALPFRLHVLGHVPDIGTFLACLDRFVLPSHGEAMPLALLEAMWARLPIVATRVGGIPEVVEDGRSGLLVEPGRPEAIAAALRRLQADPALARSLAAAARADAAARFGAGRMVADVAALYRAISSRPPRAGSTQVLDGEPVTD